MNFRNIKIALFGLIFVSSLPMAAQDLIARQAPVDRRTKAVDSVSLQRLINVEHNEEVRGLYPEWSNSYVHHYPNVEIPDSFRFDLRHFCMPTPSTKITSNYGYRRSFRRMHKGEDIKVYIGDTIRAAFAGKVRIVEYDRGGYGNYVLIRHYNGLETVYGHLSKQLVEENEEVKVGQPIGLGGNTGLSTGSHLHFEVRFLGIPIDPALLFDFPNQDIVSDYFTFHKDNNYNGNENKYAQAVEGDGEIENAPAEAIDVKYHKVERGETLYSIAKKLNITVEKLCSLNRLTTRHGVRPGQILRYEE